MKHLYQFLLSAMLTFSVVIGFANPLAEADSVTMGAGYANDIYYSMENGEVLSVDRTNWDLGFYTSAFSAAIITNDGNGVELYNYPHADTNGWDNVDTTGLSSWKVLYNSFDEWEDGAFNRNATGHPDYGWCIYNSFTHNLIGDSLYIVKFADGAAKKLWLQSKHSMASTYYFKYANLDGSNEVSVVMDCSGHADKNFLYYSMQTAEIIDREAASDSWDILFTKYMGLSNGQPYPVTGVVNNVNVPANKYTPVDPNYEDWEASPMDSTKSPIGYDWKYFDMDVFSYVVEDSTVFFVRNFKKDTYKLTFSVFDYTIGHIVFNKSTVFESDITEVSANKGFSVYPNPANQFAIIDIKEAGDWEDLVITDLSGKTVITQKVNNPSLKLDLNNLDAGMYIISLRSDKGSKSSKLIIQNN